ncbi:MAG: tripartite tricarboxylate transporter substrate binding protein, partial [Reyranella sp.]|nr:tripartite tricarboxylate transporter substrate binding protein [Reyranella sp.]
MKRRHLLALGTAAAGTVVSGRTSLAQGTYPDRPITLVVSAPPGGGTDIVARLFAEHLSKEFGQQIIIDNKGGGNGNIATALVAKAKPDGYTLLMQYSAFHTANPAMIKDLNWAPKDFTGVAMGAFAPQVIVIAKKIPVDNLKDFIAYAKANPGKLNYGSWSVGNPVHLGSALFDTVAGVDMQHVIYKETSQLYTGVATGELAYALGTSATAGPLYRAGKLKSLAIAGPSRLPAYKDVPTVAEAGGPANFEVSGWTAIAAPRGLPKAVTDKIQRDIEKALAEPDIKERFLSFGYESYTPSRAQFQQYMDSESKR